ncbi:MFS transporter [Actinosynnema sp. NPDC047251]|uniref:MFS transporter arabinose efflux permease n=1 Tax=Saccharothrix espanaensis (strain ATCC 51144 / DSM 44229 / JCM 9112 / NBRC 15066 / NRRL 15764) TaxID=1179773 RepID=K0KEQ9_SACES|nr:MFS transporter [Saccharothrix espanaensis]CCH35008.1 MFS transporter arabinose efflux permease [Saccharothrix espanaensis DSM 44229]
MSGRTHLLTAGAFAIGTSGYIVSGVLPAVSRELDVTHATAGQLLTAFAIAYAVSSPLLAALTGRWERRTLLVAALAVSAVGNLAAALAPNYPLLLAARVVSALGAAVYTPGAVLVATVLSPPEHRGRAVALVFGGLTFSLVLGVPAGNLLGEPLGYQGVFGLIAAVTALAAVAVRLGLPTVDAPPAVGLRERFAPAADRRVVMVLALTVLACLSVFAVFNYIAPLLTATAHVEGLAVSLLLVAYGVGGAFGNWAGGRLSDRFDTRKLLVAIFGSFTVVLATLPLTMTTVVGAAVALFVWGALTWSANPPIQSWLIELAPANSGLLLSLNASAIYLGVGLSGVLGGLVISWVGLLPLAPIAASLAVVALVLLVFALRPAQDPKALVVTSPAPGSLAKQWK